MLDQIKAMQQLVDLALGKPKYTYQMNRNAPQPKGPFAAVRFVSSTNPGYDDIKYIENELGLFMKTAGVRLMVFDILFSHEDDNIVLFDDAFYRPDIHALAHKLGISLMSKMRLTNKDIVLDTDWATREGVRVTTSITREYLTPIDLIEHVDVKGQYSEGDLTYPIDKFI